MMSPLGSIQIIYPLSYVKEPVGP